MTSRTTHLIVMALLVAIVLLNVLSLRQKSLTYDEPIHFRYGLQILSGNSERFVDGTMPFSALNAVPRKLAGLPGFRDFRGTLGEVKTGRYVTVLFSVVVALVVFVWARALYGNAAGVMALALYTLSPNIIAHSRLITTDVYAAGMVIIATYCFWRFMTFGGWRLAAASAALLGLSQLAKYSCLFLYPLFVLIFLVRYSDSIYTMIAARRVRALGVGFARFLAFAVLFLAVGMLIVNAGFLFNKPFMRLGDYEFRSDSFKALQARLSALKGMPVPLPYPYVEGIDWGKYRQDTGKGFGKMYLFGELREVGGFKGYYLFAFLYKVPLAMQALIVIAAVHYVVRRRRYRFRKNEVFLLGPVVFFALYFNLSFKLQIGIRHFLVVLPLLHVFCASLLKGWPAWSPKLKTLAWLPMIYLAVSVLSYFPDYIPYFNELVWDRKQAYKILADSNIDWGQDTERIQEYAKSHPEVYVEDSRWQVKRYRVQHMDEFMHPDFPDSGKILVSVNNLVGIQYPERYRWLRESYKPIGDIAHSYLMFDITPGGRIHRGVDGKSDACP
jgi:hypothetical protein